MSHAAVPDPRAVAIAGALAEAGITELVVAQPAQPARTIKARETDLPDLMSQLPRGSTLASPDGLHRFVRRSDGWHPDSADADAADSPRPPLP
ncbi:MAG: hypothetical protein ACKVS8_05305 [Phycisphaerales bacterium]